MGPPASPSSARSTTRRSPSSCPRAVRLQVPHWHPPSVTLMGLCSRAEPMRPPFRVAYAAARSCSPSMPTAAATSSAQARPAYMSEECLPLQVCRTATSPCSRTTATCPSPRYHGAASPVSGRFPPQYAPCARSSVAGHWRAPCFLRTLPSARSKIACPSVVGFGKRGTSPSFASKQASDVSACSQTLPPVYQIAIDYSLTVQVVICDTFRGFVVVAAVMLIPWLLSDCRGELPSFVLSSACPLQHPFNTVPSSSLSRALLVPVRCPRAVVRLDLWRPSERDAGPQHGFVCSCGTASSPQSESHAGRLGAAACAKSSRPCPRRAKPARRYLRLHSSPQPPSAAAAARNAHVAAMAVCSLLACALVRLVAVAFSNSAGVCCRCTAAEEAQGAAAGPVAHALRRPHQVRPAPRWRLACVRCQCRCSAGFAGNWWSRGAGRSHRPVSRRGGQWVRGTAIPSWLSVCVAVKLESRR